MTREDVDNKWDLADAKCSAKWGKLTRAERNEVAGRRHSSQVKLQELYGVGDDEAERAFEMERSRL